MGSEHFDNEVTIDKGGRKIGFNDKRKSVNDQLEKGSKDDTSNNQLKPEQKTV